MLRPVLHPHSYPRLIAFSGTPASSVVTLTHGINDISSKSSPSAGQMAVVWKQATRRKTGFEMAFVGAPIQSTGTRNFRGEAISQTGITVAQGAGTDAIQLDCIAMGYGDNYVRSDVLDVPVRCNIRGCFIQAGKVTSNVIEIGEGRTFTLTVNGTGDYTITMREAFGSVPIVALGMVTASRRIGVTSKSTTAVRINTTDLSDVAADCDFYFMFLGSRHTGGNGTEGGHQSELMAAMRNPRLLVLAGSDSGLGMGSGTATQNNHGTGDSTYTFRDKFGQEPIVCAVAHGNGTGAATVQVFTNSTSAVRLRSFDSSGVATDNSFCAFVLGSMGDAGDYEA